MMTTYTKNIINTNSYLKPQNFLVNKSGNNTNIFKYKNEIKNCQNLLHQAPIKKFMKSIQQNSIMSSNKTKINENINNNNKILHFTAERNYNQIFPNENNYSNNINHIIKRHESINNNNNKVENIKNNHRYYAIDMTTKKDNYRNNIQQNYENGFNDLKKNNINLNINNNKDNTYFINNLRKYDEKINPRNTYNSIKIPNQQNEKNFRDNIAKKTTIVLSKNKVHNSTIKTNNFRNKSIVTKNLQKYAENIKQNDQKKMSQKNTEIYIKKHQNIINKEIQRKNKFINCKVKKNDNFYILKEKRIKNFENLEDKKNEYFILKGKEKKKLLEKKLIEYFNIKGAESKKFISQETVIEILLEGKKLDSLKPNEKVKEILLLIEKYNLSDEAKKEIINKLNVNIETNKQRKIKLEENYQKNANDVVSKKKKKEGMVLSEEIEKENENFSNYKKIYGFNNEGNNCYLNSSLQLLTRINDLKNEVLNFRENYEDNETHGRLIIEFRNILKTIENSSNDDLVLNPAKLKRIMGNVDEKYNSSGQEDSNEFITNFINAILSETANREIKVKKLNIINELEKRPYENLYKKFYQRKGNSFILDLFYGITKVTKFCKKCGAINNIKFNVYNVLEFPLYTFAKKYPNKELTLEELYNKYIEEVKYDGTCSNCNNDEIYSKNSIYTLPKYLLICIQRTCDNDYFCNNVTYPKNLKLKSEFYNDSFSYILDCVIEHSGGISYGHYTALAPVDRDNKIWYKFNDSYCNKYNIGYQSRNAFILLYKLKE